jgi:hypothetical protein
MHKGNAVTHTIKYYQEIKRNEILMHATAGMNFENIMLEEACHKRPFM